MSGLDAYILHNLEGSNLLCTPILEAITKLVTPPETQLNYSLSETSANLSEGVMDEDTILVSAHFPPEKNWFYNYNFHSVSPANAYSLDVYALPNYVPEGTSIKVTQRAKASQICRFFKIETESSWNNFEKQIFSCGEKI
ncbi:hypothetical protein N9K23_01740 [Planktomarina temperata]|nr:hypothetical protein [Planktomarina temperata]